MRCCTASGGRFTTTPELNALEDKLNVDNQNIRVSFENFMAARTLIAQARAQLFPTLTAAPSYSRSRSSGNLSNTPTANTGRTGSIGTLGFDAWAPDLWGRVRNLISEQQYNAQVSAADLENVKLTEQATLALTLFDLHGQDALEAVFHADRGRRSEGARLQPRTVSTGVGAADQRGRGTEYASKRTGCVDRSRSGASGV